MIFINDLNIMQDGFRLSCGQLEGMVRYVADGGRFDVESLAKHNPKRTSLVAITEFEDGKRYIRDGLHRTAVVLLARDVPVLFEGEYVIEHMTYEMFLRANIGQQWYTPFDPRVEVRKADFFDFKEEVLLRLDDEGVVEFIISNKARYAVDRKPEHTIGNCASQLWHKCNFGGEHANHQVTA